MAEKPQAIANFYRGDTRKYKVTIRDKATGDPISVDGGQLIITMKSQKTDIDVDAVLQVKTDGVEVDPGNPTGEILAVLSSTDTDIEVGSYYYDFQFTNAAGEVTTILPGETYYEKVKVLEDITNAETLP